MKEHVEKGMRFTKENGEVIEMTVKGESELPYFNHDLWFKAALEILENMDYKDYYNEGKYDLYNGYVDELKEISDRMSNGD